MLISVGNDGQAVDKDYFVCTSIFDLDALH